MMRKVIMGLNVLLVTALVVGNMALLAPTAQAQDGEVFLPMMAGNGAVTLDEIDLTLADDNVYEIRAEVPIAKGAGEFGAVTSYEDLLIPASTPLSVRLLASGVPVVNQAIAVKLEVYGYEAAPNTKVEIVLPAGVELLDGTTKAQFDLAAGQTRSLKATIVFREIGEYDIAGSARSEISVEEEIVYADEDHLFFTIGTEMSMASAASGDNSQLQADEGNEVDAASAAAEAESAEDDDVDAAAFAAGYAGEMTEELALADDEAATASNPDAQKEDASRPGIEPASDEGASLQSAATRTISFCWRMRHRNGSNYPLYDAYYKIYDQDGTVGGSDDDLLGTGYLSYYSGCASKSVSDADGSGTADVYVEAWLTHSGRYRVTNNSGATWFARSSTKWNISGNTNFGTLYTGTYGSTGNGRALWPWRDLYWARRTINQFRGGLGVDPGYVQLRWQSGSTVGTYYSRTYKHIRLMDADVKSPDTVVHEASHAYMDNIYSGWPISDCPSPHYLNRVSGKGCAWSEGWTYVITTLVNGDGVYTWPSGGTLNMETPHCTSSNWDDGPAVEGRIGGTLIDLADPFVGLSVPQGGSYSGLSNETTGCYEDGASGMFDSIWDLLSDQDDMVFVTQGGVTDSFSNAWESRAYPRYIPHRVGHHNTTSAFTHD